MRAINLSKTYKCKVCKKPYSKRSPWQLACSIVCAVEISKTDKTSVKRAITQSAKADTKRQKEALKTRSDYVKDAQTAFNAYIRERDKDKPCISCGVALTMEAVGGGYDCGHYRSVGSAPHLRFNDHNAHGQCKKCNRYLSGNAIEYRCGLIDRIGLKAVEILESDQVPRKYPIEGLIEITRQYRQLKRELKNE